MSLYEIELSLRHSPGFSTPSIRDIGSTVLELKRLSMDTNIGELQRINDALIKAYEAHDDDLLRKELSNLNNAVSLSRYKTRCCELPYSILGSFSDPQQAMVDAVNNTLADMFKDDAQELMNNIE